MLMVSIEKYLRDKDIISMEGYLLVTKEKILLLDEAGLRRYLDMTKKNRLRNNLLGIYHITLKRIR